MSHGRPDSQQENLDDILGNGRGDPDLPSGGRWVGTGLDTATVKIVDNPHWSELPTLINDFPPREYGDNDKSDPEQNWEKED